jgi:acetyltransferase-like isoleucine patch superfamily enzyme
MSPRGALAPLLRRAKVRLVHAVWRWVQSAGMVTADTAAGRRFRRFGAGSLLSFPPGTTFGEQWIEIGEDTLIGERVTLSAGLVPGHDLGSGTVVRIGDRCSIGRGSHIVGHLSIEIGDDVFAAPYVYVTDQNHGYADPDLPIGRQWPRNVPVSIGAGSWLGTGAVILPGAKIGRNVVVAAGAVVRGDFPDHCVIAGAPARIVRRYAPGIGWEPPLRGVPPIDADSPEDDLLDGQPQAG